VRGSSLIGEEVTQYEKSWLNWKRGDSVGGEEAQLEERWLNCSISDCDPTVLSSNPALAQGKLCQSVGRMPPGIAQYRVLASEL
jgi:hypothetical protein